jgi:DNA-binding XRE family transcriptional regulator
MTQRNLDTIYIYRFGNLVRLGRERRDLSQEKLGRFVGLSRTSIVNIEKGPSRYTSTTGVRQSAGDAPRGPIAVDASDSTASRRAESSRAQE